MSAKHNQSLNIEQVKQTALIVFKQHLEYKSMTTQYPTLQPYQKIKDEHLPFCWDLPPS